MSHSAVKYAFALSLLLNVGIIGGVVYNALQHGGAHAFLATETNAAMAGKRARIP